jgi:mevalonate kinase
MPAFSASAPGKIILFGEHAVVYGRPAIAVPVSQVRARVSVSADPLDSPGLVHIQAPTIGLETTFNQLPHDHPLAFAIQLTLNELGVNLAPACTVHVSSTIPLAGGLGSGAAVSVALIRAFSAFLGHPLASKRDSLWHR